MFISTCLFEFRPPPQNSKFKVIILTFSQKIHKMKVKIPSIKRGPPYLSCDCWN